MDESTAVEELALTFAGDPRVDILARELRILRGCEQGEVPWPLCLRTNEFAAAGRPAAEAGCIFIARRLLAVLTAHDSPLEAFARRANSVLAGGDANACVFECDGTDKLSIVTADQGGLLCRVHGLNCPTLKIRSDEGK